MDDFPDFQNMTKYRS